MSGRPGLRSVLVTATFLFGGLVLTLLTGVVIARSLGDSGRGVYALVLTWYGMAAMVAEWGQSGGVTFFIAKSPEDGARGVASGRLVMLGPSVCVALIGLLLSSRLAGGSGVLACTYAVVFAMPLATAIAGAYLFAAQALSILAWNSIRLIQPVSYFILIVLMGLAGHITVLTATLCFAFSLVLQLLVAWGFGLRRGLTRGRARRTDSAWLASFGMRQMASTIPASLSGSLDKIVMANFVSSAVIGHYAIAFSIVSTTGTLAAAISAVAYPRLASLSTSAPGRIGLETSALVGAGLSTALLAVGLAGVSPWVIPFVYGAEFLDAVSLVWWCVPAIVLISLALVAASILRGRGLPGRVAAAQVIGVAVTVLLLVELVPRYGAVGAALSVAGASAATLGTLLWFWLRAASNSS